MNKIFGMFFNSIFFLVTMFSFASVGLSQEEDSEVATGQQTNQVCNEIDLRASLLDVEMFQKNEANDEATLLQKKRNYKSIFRRRSRGLKMPSVAQKNYRTRVRLENIAQAKLLTTNIFDQQTQLVVKAHEFDRSLDDVKRSSVRQFLCQNPNPYYDSLRRKLEDELGIRVDSFGNGWHLIPTTNDHPVQMSITEAEAYCESINAKLPSKTQLKQLQHWLGYPLNYDSTPIPNLLKSDIWSSTFTADLGIYTSDVYRSIGDDNLPASFVHPAKLYTCFWGNSGKITH